MTSQEKSRILEDSPASTLPQPLGPQSWEQTRFCCLGSLIGGTLSQLPKQRNTGCRHVTHTECCSCDIRAGEHVEDAGGEERKAGTGSLSRVGGRASGDEGEMRVVL